MPRVTVIVQDKQISHTCPLGTFSPPEDIVEEYHSKKHGGRNDEYLKNVVLDLWEKFKEENPQRTTDGDFIYYLEDKGWDYHYDDSIEVYVK